MVASFSPHSVAHAQMSVQQTGIITKPTPGADIEQLCYINKKYSLAWSASLQLQLILISPLKGIQNILKCQQFTKENIPTNLTPIK